MGYCSFCTCYFCFVISSYSKFAFESASIVLFGTCFFFWGGCTYVHGPCTWQLPNAQLPNAQYAVMQWNSAAVCPAVDETFLFEVVLSSWVINCTFCLESDHARCSFSILIFYRGLTSQTRSNQTTDLSASTSAHVLCVHAHYMGASDWQFESYTHA